MKEDEEIKEKQRVKDIQAVVKILVRDVEKQKELNGYYLWRNH